METLDTFKTMKEMAAKRLGNFAQSAGKKYICQGDMTSIKQRAIQAIQMMPDTMVAQMIKESPFCKSHGGKRGGKTRKQKRKQRKTRKH
jgi:hypothetical protein